MFFFFPHSKIIFYCVTLFWHNIWSITTFTANSAKISVMMVIFLNKCLTQKLLISYWNKLCLMSWSYLWGTLSIHFTLSIVKKTRVYISYYCKNITGLKPEKQVSYIKWTIRYPDDHPKKWINWILRNLKCKIKIYLLWKRKNEPWSPDIWKF